MSLDEPQDETPDLEAVTQGLRRVERELAASKRNGRRALKQLHAALIADVRAAEKRATTAEKRVEGLTTRLGKAQRRAERAEAELAELKDSATWKAGRTVASVAAVPGKLRRRSR